MSDIATYSKCRESSNWHYGGLVDWIEENNAYISAVFSWNIHQAYQKAIYYKASGKNVFVGGPAVTLNQGIFQDLDVSFGNIQALKHHNPMATFTTRGCIRKCEFCAVPRMEGEFRELDDHEWQPLPIICDNNFLASSKKHFDNVVFRLRNTDNVDFNQGLDARLLKKYHADKLAELNCKCMRLAWDNTRTEKKFMTAFETLLNAGFPSSKIHVYILIGFDDDPSDALYRLETVANLGAYPNPMRYQPLDSTHRNEYVAPNWTDAELKRYMRYWSNLRITRKIPFSEFAHRGYEPVKINDNQLQLI